MTNSIATLWKLNAKQLIDLLDKKDISPMRFWMLILIEYMK